MEFLFRIVFIICIISTLVVSTSTVGLVESKSSDRKALTSSEVDGKNKATSEIDVQLSKSSKRLSISESCGANICARLGDTISISVICSNEDPRVVESCVMLSSPSGASFSVGQGNPVTGTAIWTAGLIGTFTFRFQAIVISCPSDQTCTPSEIATVTVNVIRPSTEDQGDAESRLPDPSACDVTISPDCQKALARCVVLLGGARGEECEERYPFASRGEIEIIKVLDPKLCENSFSPACADALKKCDFLLGQTSQFCEKTYPYQSDPEDFKQLYPTSVCADLSHINTCLEAGRACQIAGLSEDFCRQNYPFESIDVTESEFLKTFDPSIQCSNSESKDCIAINNSCKALGLGIVFCNTNYPAKQKPEPNPN